MLSLRLFFSKWLRLLLFSSLVSAFACNSLELCMFGDAFGAVCHGAMDATMTVTGDTVDVSAASAAAVASATVDAAAVAVAVVVTAPSVTNSTIVVLVAYK